MESSSSGSGEGPKRSEGREKARTAARLFSRVSGAYPASVDAQSLALALICRQEELEPSSLGDYFLASTEEIESVANAANSAHGRRGKGSQTGWISPEKIESIAEYVFHRASRLMIVEDSEINNLLAKYPQYQTLEEGDDAYLAEVDSVLERYQDDE